MPQSKFKRLTSHYLSQSPSRFTHSPSKCAHSPTHNLYISRACNATSNMTKSRKKIQSSLNNYYASLSDRRHCFCCLHGQQLNDSHKVQPCSNGNEYYVSQTQVQPQVQTQVQPQAQTNKPSQTGIRQEFPQQLQKQLLLKEKQLTEIKQVNHRYKAENESLQTKIESERQRNADEIADLRHENQRQCRQLADYQREIENSRQNNQRIQSLELQIQKQLCEAVNANKLLQIQKQDKDTKLAEQAEIIRDLQNQLQVSKSRWDQIEQMQDTLCARINSNVRAQKNIFSKIEPLEKQVALISNVIKNVSLGIQSWEQEIEEYNHRLSHIENLVRQSDTRSSHCNSNLPMDSGEIYDNHMCREDTYGVKTAYSSVMDSHNFFDNHAWLSRTEF